MGPFLQSSPRLRNLIRFFALTSVGLGLGVLIRWNLGVPGWSSSGQGTIPMAPSTALLFCLFGGVICFSDPVRGWRGIPLGVASWIIAMAGSAALVMGILSALGIHPGMEHLGMPAPNLHPEAGGIPLGHISPISAAGFGLAALSHLALPTGPAPWYRKAVVSLGLAATLLVLGMALLLAYLFGVPVLYGTPFIPPAVSTCCAFIFLAAALLFRSLPQLEMLQGRSESEIGTGLNYLGVFALFSLVVFSTSYLYFRNFKSEHRAGVERQLTAIAELKVHQLMEYRRERMADAAVLGNTPGFPELVAQVLLDSRGVGASRARLQLETWMDQIRSLAQYDLVRLADGRGRLILSSSELPAPFSSELGRGIAEALRSGQVQFQDFYLSDKDHRAHLALLIPILHGASKKQVIGVLVLRIDPQVSLYPFLKRWPIPSDTAETLLVRREGEQVVFLSELRFAQAAPLHLRAPLSRPNLLAARAALGYEGAAEGRDYRGMPVYAALRQVPGSTWSLVARIDIAEAFAPVRARVWQVFGLDVMLLVSATWGLGLLWRQQRLRILKADLEAERQRQKLEVKYRAIFDHTAEGVFQVTPGGKLLLANRALASILGFDSPEELIEDHTDIERQSYVRPERRQEYKRLLDEQGQLSHFDYEVYRRDGSIAWVSESSRAVRDEAGEIQYYEGMLEDITQRKTAALELEAAKDFAENLIQTANVMVVGLDAKGGLDIFNATAEKISGYSKAELEGRNWFEVLVPRDRYPQVWDEFSRLLTGGMPRLFENPILTKAGEERIIAWSNSESRSGGQAAGTLSFGMDVTERKRAEEALRGTEEKFRRTFELMPNAMTLQTRDGVLLDCNDAFCEATGYAREELLGHTTLDLGLWTDIELRGEMRDILRREGRVDGLEIVFHRRNGQQRIMQLSARYMVLDPEPLVLAVAQDITERKQADVALRESRALLKSIISSTSDAIYVKDLEGRYLLFNTAAEAFVGRSAEEVLGQDDRALFPPEEAAAVMEGDRRLLAEAVIRTYEERVSDATGRPAVFLSTKGPLRDEGGHLMGMFGIARDITERKRREEELQQKTTEMERFTYMISHDLKSPLVTVRTFLGYLEQDLGQGKVDRAAKDMDFIRAASAKMGRLLDDLLELSRVGRVVNPPVKVSTTSLIQAALAAVAGAISARGVEVQILGPSLQLFGDRPRLEDLWQNLVENAVKYMGDQASPRIALGVERQGDDPVFFIRDNGIGIDRRFHDKVFGLFEKLDPSSEGTGLGLALVRRIVELYEGRIWLESEGQGLGACFFFTLPSALKSRTNGARP